MSSPVERCFALPQRSESAPSFLFNPAQQGRRRDSHSLRQIQSKDRYASVGVSDSSPDGDANCVPSRGCEPRGWARLVQYRNRPSVDQERMTCGASHVDHRRGDRSKISAAASRDPDTDGVPRHTGEPETVRRNAANAAAALQDLCEHTHD